MILQLLIVTVASWINRHQQQVIAYLKEENHVLKSKLPGSRLRLSDPERRRLAALAHPLGRKQLEVYNSSSKACSITCWTSSDHGVLYCEAGVVFEVAWQALTIDNLAGVIQVAAIM